MREQSEARLPRAHSTPEKTEIARPVSQIGKVETLFQSANAGQGVKIEESPMRMVMQAMARAETAKNMRNAEPLTPPVPMRYMTALMLQSLSKPSEAVDIRI